MTFLNNTVDFHRAQNGHTSTFGLRDIPGIKEHVRPGTRIYSAYGPTHDIKTPSFNTTLWRYTDIAKFLSLLEDGALFFTRLDKLMDPFEGAWSEINLKMIQLGLDSAPNTKLSMEMQAWRMIVNNCREQRRYTLVNCWHEGEHESEAMWKLYSGLGYGLAIRTDFKTLVHSFTTRVPDIVAKVEYISYETDAMPWSLRASFLHKRLSFAHEREVRAVMQCFNFRPSDKANGSEYDYSRDVCNVGIPFAVDTNDLIQEVVVSPYAESWMFELVRSVCKRYGMSITVRKSDLAKDPVW